MAWFKVDDRLHLHHKTRKIRRSNPGKTRDSAPFGLWVLAGSWCGQSGTNGFIPLDVLEEFDDDAYELAQRLVEADMFIPDTVDGDDGYWFHNYSERNPVEEVDPGVWGNHLRWHVKRGETNPDCVHCIGATRGDIGGESPPESSPVPSRPVPNPSRPDISADDGDRFDQFWKAYPRKVGKGQARKAWKAATAKAAPDVLIKSAEQFAEWCAAESKDPTFIPYPTTWLNGERWADERPARTTRPTRLDNFSDLARRAAQRDAEHNPTPEIEAAK